MAAHPAHSNILLPPGKLPPAIQRIWLYAFMTGVRSSRRLETACREQLALRLGLVDWAVQAVDGTKVAGSASSSRTDDAQQPARLLRRAGG